MIIKHSVNALKELIMLWVELECPGAIRRSYFKFMNHIAESLEITDKVAQSMQVRGDPMYVIWRKLKLLIPEMRKMQRPYSNIQEKIRRGRTELEGVQQRLSCNRFDRKFIEEEEISRNELKKWCDIEERILAQRAKITCLKLGDGNSVYLHVSVREKNKGTRIHRMRDDGVEVTSQEEIEKEMTEFYRKLVGQDEPILRPEGSGFNCYKRGQTVN